MVGLTGADIQLVEIVPRPAVCDFLAPVEGETPLLRRTIDALAKRQRGRGKIS